VEDLPGFDFWGAADKVAPFPLNAARFDELFRRARTIREQPGPAGIDEPRAASSAPAAGQGRRGSLCGVRGRELAMALETGPKALQASSFIVIAMVVMILRRLN